MSDNDIQHYPLFFETSNPNLKSSEDLNQPGPDSHPSIPPPSSERTFGQAKSEFIATIAPYYPSTIVANEQNTFLLSAALLWILKFPEDAGSIGEVFKESEFLLQFFAMRNPIKPFSRPWRNMYYEIPETRKLAWAVIPDISDPRFVDRLRVWYFKERESTVEEHEEQEEQEEPVDEETKIDFLSPLSPDDVRSTYLVTVPECMCASCTGDEGPTAPCTSDADIISFSPPPRKVRRAKTFKSSVTRVLNKH